MTDVTAPEVDEHPKGSKLPLILGLVLMFAGGGAGFFAAFSGVIFGGDSARPQDIHQVPELESKDVSFVAIEPISVSLPPDNPYKHLRFRAELEVNASYRSEIETIMPRIVNVMNGYLRAVEASDLAEPASLTRLRTQLLRRAQIVAGQGRINDLLIMEFVLN